MTYKDKNRPDQSHGIEREKSLPYLNLDFSLGSMFTDKDRPSTWMKYRNGMCEGCYGSCCTMPVEVTASDLVRLGVATEDEVEISCKKLAKRLIKEKIVQSYREGTDLFMLSSRPNGDCLYLDFKTRLCVKYDLRPDVCRKFPSIGPRPGYCPVRKK